MIVHVKIADFLGHFQYSYDSECHSKLVQCLTEPEVVAIFTMRTCYIVVENGKQRCAEDEKECRVAELFHGLVAGPETDQNES